MAVYRIYVEKKQPFAVEAGGILADIQTSLQIGSVYGVRLLNRYDVEGISEEVFKKAVSTVFSEPSVDDVSYTPVSYTHLDVYKRQGWIGGSPGPPVCNAFGDREIFVPEKRLDCTAERENGPACKTTGSLFRGTGSGDSLTGEILSDYYGKDIRVYREKLPGFPGQAG